MKWRNLAQRILEVCLTLIIVSILSFLLMRLSPVDPATAYARRNMMNPTQEQINQVRVEMGLDQSLFVQYMDWLSDALHLDFGVSLVNEKPAFGELITSVPVTMKVVLLAAVIETAGILFFGCLLYLGRDNWRGYLLGFLTLAGISIPAFYIANVYLDVFAVKFGMISVAGNVGFMKYFHPAICLAAPNIAFFSRLLNSEMLREEKEDYVFYARCRGLSEGVILIFHILPNGVIALIPNFLQNIGLSFAGASIIERVFSLPGLGYLIVDSVLNRDSPMIHMEVLFLALVLVIFNILSEWIQTILQKQHLSKGEAAL